MSILLTYLKVFAVGGFICLVAQVLINLTKLTPARILVIFLMLGIFLETLGVFKYIKEFASAGATIPILGFGSNLAKGAIDGAKEQGFLGAILGGVQAASAGLSGAIFVGFLVSLFSSAKSKK